MKEMLNLYRCHSCAKTHARLEPQLDPEPQLLLVQAYNRDQPAQAGTRLVDFDAQIQVFEEIVSAQRWWWTRQFSA